MPIPGPCDRGVASTVAPTAPATRPILVLAGTVLGSSLAFIDGSAVNLILPVVQERLGGDVTAAQWIMNAYMLLLGALVLAGGAAADRYGRKRVFTAGVLLFSVASLACGLAPNLPTLIAARAVQGVGAALLTPASLAILGASFDEKGRGQAVGIWAGASGLAGAVGPVLGGWLTEAISWRAVFLINLPVAVLAVGMVWAGATESRSSDRGPIDLAGVVSVTGGLAAVTWALTIAPERGFADPVVAVALAGGLAALAAFIIIERKARRPLVPLRIFRSRAFSGANLLTLLLYAAFTGALFLLPFELIRAHGYSPGQAGAALLPLSAGLVVLSPIMGRLTPRIGARLPLTVGPLIAGAGFALLAAMAGEGDYWRGVFPGLAVLALGIGVSVAPLTDAVLGAVDAEYEGSASGINNAVARIAGLLAVALLGFALRASPEDAGALEGQALASGYRIAMISAAVAAVLAGATGAATIRGSRKMSGR